MTAGLVFVGCGNMGGALITGYASRVPDASLFVVDTHVEKARSLLRDNDRIRIMEDVDGIGDAPVSATVLAVKPQSMPAVLPRLAPLPLASGLVISVAAGITTGTIRAALPRARIVRAMPNTPAMLGLGVTGLWCDVSVTAEDRAMCEVLFGAVGAVHWVDAEQAIDAVTAVSGSGPAYVFAVAEAMEAAARELGFEPALAHALVRDTIAGAAAILTVEGAKPAELKSNVRSPKGTTDAALRVFEDGDTLVALFVRAMQAARARAAELSEPS